MSDFMNYQFQDPMQTFLRMSQFGSGIAQQRAAGMTAQFQAQEAEAKLAMARAKAEADAARQAQVDAAMERLGQPGVTAADYLRVAMLLPKEQADAMREAAKALREDERAAALQETGAIFSAFQAKRPDLAAQLLRRQADAERAANNELGASMAEEWIKTINEGDPEKIEALQHMFGTQLTFLTGGTQAIDAIVKLGEERRAAREFPILLEQKQSELSKAKSEADKQAIEAKYAERIKEAELAKYAGDLELTSAQAKQALANADKLSADTQKLLLENKAAEARGDGLAPEKVFQIEKQLRDEYVKRTGQFTELRGTYDTIRASAADGSGAGDVALVTGFMKMLDPGSVVRETEFANARDTAGLFGLLQATAKKLKDGQFLTPEQRSSFANLAAKYMEASSKYEKEIRSDMTGVVKSWGLSEDNIFGASRAAPGFGAVAKPQVTKEVDF